MRMSDWSSDVCSSDLNIRLDDEIPTLRQILIRPRLVELLSKLRDVGLKGVVRNLSAMGDQADFALCRTGREELENPNMKSLLLIIRRQRERALIDLHLNDLTIVLAQIVVGGKGGGWFFGVPDYVALSGSVPVRNGGH